jgi:tRNA(Ile)-lysidine synthase
VLGPFEKLVRATLDPVFGASPRAVVAVSGGPDSMALLHALVRIGMAAPGPELVVAHFDHGLRGSESAEDAAFVAAAADRLRLECVIGRDDVAGRARAVRRNLEAVARELRYEFLLRAALERGAPRVATGHTASDQAETVLMRLGRGAGVDGLAGIASTRPLAKGVLLVRPLLALTRKAVLGYCAEREIPYRIDATNADVELTRACVRHEILPRLERATPGATANLARTAALAADDREYFADVVARTLLEWNVAETGPAALPAAAVLDLPPAVRRRVLREAVRRARGDLKRLTAAHVEMLERLAERGSGAAELPYGVRARREGHFLIVERVARKSG